MGDAHPRPTVFLSYARSDREPVARLAAALEAAGLDVWWDSLIEGGAEFAKSIAAALDKCDAVVACWSRSSVTSDWVLDEAGRGRELHKLVPVTLDGAEPPLGFRQYHAIDLSHWQGEPGAAEIGAIARAIAGARRRAAEPNARPNAHPHPHRHPHSHAPGRHARVTRRRVLLITAGIAGVSAAGVTLWRLSPLRGAAARPTSVAVLPFENLSGSADQDYFSDGLSEELRATLARNDALQVMAQASSRQFRDRTEDAVTIAAKLGVDFLLDGSVRRSGDNVRVTADVIDGGTGFSRWSEIFERPLSDIFAVQSEIAATVAHALITRFAPGVENPVVVFEGSAGGTLVIAAYDAFLRGRALYDLSADEASERAALAQFDVAIAADPGYAAAHAARARSLTAIANQYGKVTELAALYDAAVASAERAIEIAPDLADAHSTLGFTLFQGRLDARAARAPFERSRRLGAGEATVLARFAQYSARCGRHDEARDAMRRALPLDRLNPLIHRAAGSIEYAARRWENSIAPARRALAMNPKLSRAHAAIGDALLMLGRKDEAQAEYLAEPVEDFRLTGLALVEHARGDTAAAEAALLRLVTAQGDRVLYQQAQVLAQLGRRLESIGKLERALELGDSGLIYARNDPFLDPLRVERRFMRLLVHLGFD
jgi:TolB-like protein/tetratricopeptide (TPR) repeat protein